MAFTAYHKDDGLDRHPDIMRLNAQGDFDLGPINVSPWTIWKEPDPAYWVQQGYAVVTIDSRGYGKYEGVACVLTKQDRSDFHDAITWAGTLEWSTENVGLTGVSYLAIAQWVAASATPPEYLKAIMPWEGQTDSFRDVQFHGGIPETAFTAFWSNRVKEMANETSLPPTSIIEFASVRPMLMRWLQDNLQPPSGIDLESIAVPALIGASWSDQGLHTRGSLEGFKRIASDQKWLYLHGQPKWAVYYSDEARETQTAFFDHFLKGEDNGFDTRPRVRMDVRDTLTEYGVSYAEDWPLPSTVYTPLYLNASDATLREEMPADKNVARYDAQTGEVVFRTTFDQETELTGNMKLRLWVQPEGAPDMDLFIAVRKYDTAGEEVMFYGKTGFNQTPAALGWLRVSQRELDAEQSMPQQPVLTHTRSLPIDRGEIVPVEIEILPSSTRFAPGETLEISIQGYDQFDHPTLAHDATINEGTHLIHTGGRYDAHLLVPVIPNADADE
jgi:predicted acyl esterase